MNRTNSVLPLTAAILAGGQGSRFGGADKGLLTLNGKFLIERMLMQLASQADHIVINANRNLEIYRGYEHPVVSDENSKFEGPLAGISAVLHQACTEWVLFVPVDAVQLPADYAHRMCAAVHQNSSASGSSAAVVHDGVSIVPVACLINMRLRESLDATLVSSQGSVRDWLHKNEAVQVHFDEHPRAYWSVNTPAELQALEIQTATKHSS